MNSKCKKYMWMMVIVILLVFGTWVATKKEGQDPTQATFKSKASTDGMRSKSQMALSESTGQSPAEINSSVTENSQKESTENQMKYLLQHLGERPPEPSSGNAFHDMIEKSKKENTTPVEDRYPNAKKLISMGDIIIIPLAVHLANFQDSRSDNFVASYKTLLSLRRPDQIRDLYHELENKAHSEEERQRFKRAAQYYRY
jgi:hypothetical protein